MPLPTPQPFPLSYQDWGRITRLDIIDETGRVYSRRPVSIEPSLQDGNLTLKIFVENRD